MREKITTMETHGQRPLAPLSSPHAAVTMEATSSFSLSLSRYTSAHALYNYFLQKYQQLPLFFALSHIYTYMTFGLFTHLSLPISRTDRNFHPKGPVSQQTPPSLRHGMSL